MFTQNMDEKFSDVYSQARIVFDKRPDWVTFYREVLGVGGIIRNSLANSAELTAFEQSKEFGEIQLMLAKLRIDKEANSKKNGDEPEESGEPTRVITVRMPKSLHESLRAEAHERKTSMNKLCISKLVQFIEDELVPADA